MFSNYVLLMSYAILNQLAKFCYVDFDANMCQNHKLTR